MTANDPVVAKRQYWKEIPPDTEFEKLPTWSSDYRQALRSRKCITCNNAATWMLYNDIGGATFTEKYCDNCRKEGKHIQENNELMRNFDKLFLKAKPET
jgi:hypothetical protein